MIADPVLEIARIAHGEKSRLEPGQNAKRRSDDAELQQRFEWLERIGEKFSAVKNARSSRTLEHVVGQKLVPKIVNFFRLGEKPMTADVEVKTFVGRGTGNSADINRIGFQHGDADIVLGQKISGG